MIEVDIEEALFEAATELATAMSLPAKFPLDDFTPPNDNKYLEVAHLRNRNTNIAWDVGTVFQGILQIAVHYPINQGSLPATRLAAEVVAAFPKGRKMVKGLAKVRIDETPSISSPIESGQDAFVQVSVRYLISDI